MDDEGRRRIAQLVKELKRIRWERDCAELALVDLQHTAAKRVSDEVYRVALDPALRVN